MITRELVRRLFSYNKGVLYWKVRHSPRIQIGDEAGGVESLGYSRVNIDGKQYKSHRVIFLHQKGYLPKFIDHIDEDKLNNDISNLRECTGSQNQHNLKKKITNTSGVKGVHWDRKAEKWKAQIKILGKQLYLGSFHDKDVASQIVRIKRLEIHGEFANHG